MSNLAINEKLQGLYRKDAHISLYVADLGAYVSGHLRGVWVSLPLEEEQLDELFNMAEELAIHDYECSFMQISEYESIRDLNAIAERLEKLDEQECELVKEYMDNVSSDFEEAMRTVENNDYSIYHNCSDMTDVAERYCEECGILNDIPDNLRSYFDFEAYGRDMDLGSCSTFVFLDNGNCVEFYG